MQFTTALVSLLVTMAAASPVVTTRQTTNPVALVDVTEVDGSTTTFVITVGGGALGIGRPLSSISVQSLENMPPTVAAECQAAQQPSGPDSFVPVGASVEVNQGTSLDDQNIDIIACQFIPASE
ncbi:hypothetical protein B0H66DRAFT_538660 [Apodospora peruviana]|uniref:Uncharacterized protein n=1 Tax=Apodospora peruviana TaxID=516989 RepID=A0AAE0HT34_9PEZI|nr:hypothetical protein B0H66DRAFT_538660 [Apodospora peruviana]